MEAATATTVRNHFQITLLSTLRSLGQFFEQPSRIDFRSLVFPIVPKTLGRFVTCLFWHSLFMTVATPLARIVYGRWTAVGLLVFLFPGSAMVNGNDDRIKKHHQLTPNYSNTTAEPEYPDVLFYRQTSGIDKAFGLHAAFGLLWLTVGCLQIGPVRRHSLSWHRNFGYFALATFICHLGASINNLIYDHLKHHYLNRVGLGSVTTLSATYMVLAFAAARRHNFQHHSDLAFRAFIYSIEGSGSIRTVYSLNALLRPISPEAIASVMYCHKPYPEQAGQCVGPYFIIMILTRLLSMYYIGIYNMIQSSQKKQDFQFLKFLVKEIIMSVLSIITFMAIDHFFPN